ncbi:4-hydroxy-3-methylbut-2-enyl diphosphate reductase [Lentisphaerota bacterium ZTH]|nr:4-hydroxy-3-methylbut-2-enyl diphosphate reductase [Lentisphaerota bacterium]WET06606.1 4-hydroxy-3-methylbut-2-enyl diphosphate reductase [Lentisphaerota bacterium ZTH]
MRKKKSKPDNSKGRLLLAMPRGFCAGVRRALEIVDNVLQEKPPVLYVFHEIVHNRFVVEKLRGQGVIFVESVEKVPPGATLILSAHGVAPEIEQQASQKGLNIVDATCPLVKKIHRKACQLLESNHLIILIGHRGHPEITGTLGQTGGQAYIVQSPEEVAALPALRQGQTAAYLTQTTLSQEDVSEVVAALKHKYPSIEGDGDICYATTNRQEAVRKLAPLCKLVLVIGSPNSSNSQRLREVARRCGVQAILIDGPEDINPTMLPESGNIGITAGASAPECLVVDVVQLLQLSGWSQVEEMLGDKPVQPDFEQE